MTCPRKCEHRSRKTIGPRGCLPRGRSSTFSITPQGKPGGGPGQEVRSGESHSAAVVRVTGATGKPRASGRSDDRTGILRDRRAVLRTAGLTTRKVLSETRGCDFRIAHRRWLRPAATLRSELGPRLDTERTRAPRGLRLRPRLPRGFLVLAWCVVRRVTMAHQVPATSTARGGPRSVA